MSATPSVYQLSYVNLRDGTTDYLDQNFTSLAEIETFVTSGYPNASSYQIIVVLPRASKIAG